MINLKNWVVIGLMAMTFFVLAKMIFGKFKIAGISDIVERA